MYEIIANAILPDNRGRPATDCNMKLNYSAIYQIKNIINGKLYVGSAKNFHERKTKHLNFLKHNKHHCIYLQAAYNKYGEENFVFEILEINIDLSILVEREQHWMDLTKCYNSKFGYNILAKAKTSLGSKRTPEQKARLSASQKGIERSAEARKNMSLAKIGKGHSPEAIQNMRNAKKEMSRWNCPDGSRCKCLECLPIRQMERRKADEKAKANKQTRAT